MDENMSVNYLPKPGELWARPEKQAQGDPDPRDLYTSVGIALTSWEAVENAYAQLFAGIMHGGMWNAAPRVYGSIISPSGRRDALAAAAEIFFHGVNATDEHRDQLKILLNHHQQATARRNDIAHGVVSEISERGFYLIPSPYNTTKTKDFFLHMDTKGAAELNMLDLYDYAYTAKEILAFGALFQRMHIVISLYHMAITTYVHAKIKGAPQSPQPK
jgi:hypothetical protein